MSNTYQVISANYDGSYPSNPLSSYGDDPTVWVYLARNGARLGYALVYWSQIQNIFAVAGASGLQSYFASIADRYAGGGPSNPPSFPKNTQPIPAPVTGTIPSRPFNPDNGVPCTQALVPAWQQ